MPSEVRRRRKGEPRDPDRPAFRLVVTRGQLAVELAAPFALGPLEVEDIALSLPGIEFPVDLSGGVAAFRNRRGRLERVGLSLPAAALASWGLSRVEAELGREAAWIAAPLEDGWLLGAVAGRRALAFEVLLAPLDSDLRLIPTAARGIGLDEPAQALALRLLAALARPLGKRVGGAVIVEQAPALVAQALLPLAGMRAPASSGVRFVGVGFDVTRLELVAEREGVPAAMSNRQIRALELATLVAEAEEALSRSDLDGARRGYLAALERAPRHVEIARRLAELDLAVGGRAEAALSTLSDAMPPQEAGVLGARLLAAVGDAAGAEAALGRAAAQEPYGALAALVLREQAQLVAARGDRAGAAALLDEAVARAPSLASVRWERFERRARAGQPANADLEHLEAACRGAGERHALLRRAAELWSELGAHEAASECFERALRYLPDSVEAVVGLSRALGALGHRRRALELAGRAVALAERAGREAPAAVLELARLLAEVADDRPAAIAHARAVPPFSPYAFEARLLEARWRAELGDLTGASEALARLAQAVEAALGVLVPGPRAPEGPFAGLGTEGPYASREDARVAIAVLLEEGARLQEIDRGDRAAARRLLELAVALAPRRGSLRRALQRLAPEERAAPPSGRIPPRTAPRAPFAASPSAVPPALHDARAEPKMPPPPRAPAWSTDRDGGSILAPPTLEAAGDGIDLAEAEQRVEQLTERLRANPGDAAVAEELAALLAQLGRDHDLLALLSARLDEADEAAREPLIEQRRMVLERMVAAARAAGREDEAELLSLMLERR